MPRYLPFPVRDGPSTRPTVIVTSEGSIRGDDEIE